MGGKFGKTYGLGRAVCGNDWEELGVGMVGGISGLEYWKNLWVGIDYSSRTQTRFCSGWC